MKKVIIDEIEYVPREKEIETWKDTETGLIWNKLESNKTMTWEEAIEYAKTLKNDWRIPTIQELVTLVNFSRNNPACKITSTHCSYYWSSTIYADDTRYAWSVDFYDGDISYDDKNNNFYVYYVKGKK